MTTTTLPTHTPGPWNYMTRRTMHHVETDMDAPVAGEHICSIPLSQEANARLIAAAPDLLAALQVAVRYVEESASPFHKEHNAALESIRAAIAKAEGIS